MNRDDLVEIATLLLASTASKPLAIIMTIIAIVTLTVGGIIIWYYKLTTAIVLGAFGFLFLWFLSCIDALDVERMPYVIFLPLILFISGLIIERSELSILKLQTIGLSALNPAIFTLNGSVVMFWIIIALAVGGLIINVLRE